MAQKLSHSGKREKGCRSARRNGEQASEGVSTKKGIKTMNEYEVKFTLNELCLALECVENCQFEPINSTRKEDALLRLKQHLTNIIYYSKGA